MKKLLNAFFKGKSKPVENIAPEKNDTAIITPKVEKEIDVAAIPPFLRNPNLPNPTNKSLEKSILASNQIQKVEPQNPIEIAIQQLHKKEISIRDFIDKHFWNTQFFVLTNEKPETNANGEITSMPQILTIGINNLPHACLFTSIERAKSINPQAGHSCAIEVNAQALVDLFKGRCGIVINYGWDLTVALDPEFNEKLYEAMQKHFAENNPSQITFRSEPNKNCMTEDAAVASIKELLQNGQSAEILQNFVKEKFSNMILHIPLRNLAKNIDNVKEFSIDDILIISGPDQRPYLPVFSHTSFLEKLKSDTAENLQEIVTLSGIEILTRLPKVCGIAINPNTDCFVALTPQD